MNQLLEIDEEQSELEKNGKSLQQFFFKLFMQELSPADLFRQMISPSVSKCCFFSDFTKLINRKIIELDAQAKEVKNWGREVMDQKFTLVSDKSVKDPNSKHTPSDKQPTNPKNSSTPKNPTQIEPKPVVLDPKIAPCKKLW